MEQTPSPKRRFGGWTTWLTLIAIFAVGVLVFVVPTLWQRSAVAEFERLGGKITYDYGQLYARGAEPDRPSFVEEVFLQATVDTVRLDCTSITDDGLRGLASLPQVKAVYLNNTGVTDAGLAHLEGLVHLEHVELYGTRVTNEGIAALREKLDSASVYYTWQPN